MKKVLTGFLGAVAMLAGAFSVHAEPSPTEHVRGTVDAVLAIVQDKGIDPEERRMRIAKTVRTRFDFRSMSERALAAEWRQASPEEQQRFETLFSELLENTYVGRIETYSNEQVKYRRERVRGDKAMVETVIVTKTVEIPMDYKMLHKEEGWFVYDVVIEGVSLIRNFRTTYGEIVKNEGFDGLFRRMEDKIAELKGTAPKG